MISFFICPNKSKHSVFKNDTTKKTIASFSNLFFGETNEFDILNKGVFNNVKKDVTIYVETYSAISSMMA